MTCPQAEASTKKSGTKSSSCDSSFWSSTKLFGKNQKRRGSSTMSSITQLLRPSIFTTSLARREAAAASVSPRVHGQYETVTSPATASTRKSNLPTQNFSKDTVEMTKSTTAAKKKQQQQSSLGIINSSHSNSPKEMNLKSKPAAAGEYCQADRRGGVRFMLFFRKVPNKSSSSSS